MNTDQNFQLPRFSKPIDITLTALGISLFIAFAVLGVRQADDKKIVTGNNQQQFPAAQDVKVPAFSDDTPIPFALSTTTQPDRQINPANKPENTKNELSQNKVQEKLPESALDKGRAEQSIKIREN